MYCGHLPWDVAKQLDVLCSLGEHKMGLTCSETSLGCLKVLLIFLDFDGKVGDIIVDFPILCDLPRQAPVVSIGHHGLEDVEVAPRASEHVPEPRG